MQGRLDHVSNRGSERLETIATRRKELMDARIAALENKMYREARRAYRQGLKQNRALSHAEREQQIAVFMEADKARIRKAAVASFRI